MTALLRVDGVSKAHRRGSLDFPILRGATLDVEAGRVVAIFGDRGAGKTTLLRIAAGLDTPDSGRVLFDDVEIAAMNRRARNRLRQAIAVVTRDQVDMPELTLAADVSLRMHGQGRRRARASALQALDRAGLADRADHRWADLSDADRTLAKLAKALAHTPRLMILDDPLAGLDLIDSERVAELLREVADQQGCGVLVAAPDLSTLTRHADDFHSLVGGQLFAAERAEQDDHPGGDVIDFSRARHTA